MKTRTVILISGEIRIVPLYSYVVQSWESGRWGNIETFPNTEDGYRRAKELMNMQEFEARVNQLF